MSKIFLIGADDALMPMNETAYENEALLQMLLERYPKVLAGHSAGPASDARWLLVTREFGVPDRPDGAARWSLDHLFLDQEGVPALVEVKRERDTRIRREVVAQMLDYVANAVVYWPVDGIRAKFEAGCQARGRDPADEVRGLAGRFDPEDGSAVERGQSPRPGGLRPSPPEGSQASG